MKYIKKPCNECPWRKSAETGRFTEERWDSLARSSARPDGSSAEFSDPIFACHITAEGKEQACAGWLAMEGANHPRVRLDVITGAIPVCALEPGENWPDLHDNFSSTRDHDMEVGP